MHAHTGRDHARASARATRSPSEGVEASQQAAPLRQVRKEVYTERGNEVNAYEQEIKRYVESAATLGMPLKGYAYGNYMDFLNQHGAFYEPRVKPKSIEWGERRMSFGNAIAPGMKFGWRSVGGIAFAQIPLHHAWNLDRKGRLIDITWRTTGKAYYGVEFSLGRADDATWEGD